MEALKERFEIEDFQKVNYCKDYVFKEGVNDEKIIEEIVKIIMGEEIKIISCEAEKNYRVGEKLGEIYCDVIGVKNDYGIIDLEMQARITKDLIERAQLYISMLLVHSNQKDSLGKKQKNYQDIPRCVSIWFTVGDVFESKNPINQIEYKNESNELDITSKAIILFCNIKRWSEMKGELSEICHFLLESTEEVYLQSKSHVVELLYQRITKMKQNKIEEARYMKHEYEIYEAREEAREEATIKFILNLKAKEYDDALISDAVDLPIEEVQQIIKSHVQA